MRRQERSRRLNVRSECSSLPPGPPSAAWSFKGLSFSGSANLILNLAEVIGATLSSGGRGETLGRKHGRKTGRGEGSPVPQREREVEVGSIPGHQEEECF